MDNLIKMVLDNWKTLRDVHSIETSISRPRAAFGGWQSAECQPFARCRYAGSKLLARDLLFHVRNGDKRMMRVRITECGGELVVEIEGRLAGATVHELEEYWRTARVNLPNSRISVDLERVTCIDRAGHSLLQLMHRHGVDFPHAGPAIQSVLEQVMERSECRH